MPVLPLDSTKARIDAINESSVNSATVPKSSIGVPNHLALNAPRVESTISDAISLRQNQIVIHRTCVDNLLSLKLMQLQSRRTNFGNDNALAVSTKDSFFCNDPRDYLQIVPRSMNDYKANQTQIHPTMNSNRRIALLVAS
jgi:hypothetical protein